VVHGVLWDPPCLISTITPPPVASSEPSCSVTLLLEQEQKIIAATTTAPLLSIELMDEEHSECFDIIERASQLIHDDQEMMRDTLRELYCHLQDHFDHEEHLMNQCKFGGGIGGQGWQGHHSDHERILRKISVLLDGPPLCLSDHHESIKEFLSGLARDLNQHIAQYDSLYVETFHKHGIN
jgi:Hemerythrin